jgi:DNA-binding MarR family transcriptional regulator
MIQSRAADAENIASEVRRLFQILKALADAVHKDAGLNASHRAVLESLAEGPRTVPDIARQKSVTRQHIQLIADALLGMKLIELRENPAHRRSPLLALTRDGKAAFADIRKREAPLLDLLGADIEPRKAAATLETLSALSRAASEVLRQHATGDSDDL